MTPEQKALLRQTFESLIPLSSRFGRRFYEKLFEVDPDLKALFRGDPDRQASMLAEALTLAVLHLVDQGTVSQEIRRLGARHRALGVDDAMYGTFGAALVATLEERRGDAFTPEVRAAWTEAWRQLSAAMQESEPSIPPAN